MLIAPPASAVRARPVTAAAASIHALSGFSIDSAGLFGASLDAPAFACPMSYFSD
jgi:hypothetical protein